MESAKIISNLKHDGAGYRLKGIIECFYGQVRDPEVFDALRAMRDDDVVLAGYKLSTYAAAILDVFDAETYSGTEEEVTELISRMKEYLQEKAQKTEG